MVKRFKTIAKEAEGVANDTADTVADTVASKVGKLTDNQFVSAVKDSAQQIWLAGLGAFSKTQEEGTKVFDVLVKEGMTLQKRTVKMTESRLAEVSERVTSMTGDLTKTATGTWDKLEGVFEERVARSLNRLGVPTNKDIQTLTRRVEELTAALQGMGVKPVKTPAAKTVAKAKKVVKKVARKAAK